MGYKATTCPNCGASIQLNDSREYGFCEYCGTKIAIDKIIVINRGDVEAALERTRQFLEIKNFYDAGKYCNKALDIDPKNYQAHIYMLMVLNKCSEFDQLGELSELDENGHLREPLHSYIVYQKAFQFAPEDIKAKLQILDQKSSNRYEAAKKRYMTQIENMEADLKAKRNKLDRRRIDEKKAHKMVDNHQKYIKRKIILIALVAIYAIPLFILQMTSMTVNASGQTTIDREHNYIPFLLIAVVLIAGLIVWIIGISVSYKNSQKTLDAISTLRTKITEQERELFNVREIIS